MSTVNGATALIADDEPALRTELEWLLGDAWPELVVTASVGDGASALEAIDRLQPDVAFLDIRMPPPSGLEVARRVGPGTAVVFVTAYDNHAVEAFEYAAIDYLLKPVLWPRLQETVRRLKRWLMGGGRSLLDPQLSNPWSAAWRTHRPTCTGCGWDRGSGSRLSPSTISASSGPIASTQPPSRAQRNT